MDGSAAWIGRAQALVAQAAAEGSPLVRFGAPAISLAVLGAAMLQLGALDWRAVLSMVPASPAFWYVFVIAYFIPVVCDWAIYRRLWQLPGSALAPFARKMIGNDLLVGYAGEAYLFAWARRQGQSNAAAFGAVKDVAILSAVVGSLSTLLAAVAAAPFLRSLDLGIPAWAMAASIGAILLPPVLAVLLRRRVLSLPQRDLAATAGIHAIRAGVTIGLTALLWHLALPGIAVAVWLNFSALKLLVSRLPVVANRELVFAGLTVALFGRQADVPALMTMMVTLHVAMHAVVGTLIAAPGVIEGARLRRTGRETATA